MGVPTSAAVSYLCPLVLNAERHVLRLVEIRFGLCKNHVDFVISTLCHFDSKKQWLTSKKHFGQFRILAYQVRVSYT